MRYISGFLVGLVILPTACVLFIPALLCRAVYHAGDSFLKAREV